MDVEIHYEQTDAQREFHNDIESSMLMFSGGLGSGKSYGLCMKMLQLSWLNRHHAGGLLCPSVPEFKRDIRPIFDDIFYNHGMQGYAYYHISDRCYYFPWSDKPLYIFTADRPIAGPNLAYCGINEFSLMNYDRINEMLRRVRVKSAPVLQRCLVGTPEDEYGWLEEFIDNQTKTNRLKVITSKTTDNPHISEDYIKHLKDTLDPQAFKLFAEGLMISLTGGMFYYSYSEENRKEVTYQDGQLIHINVDFNVGNMTATIAHVLGRGNNKEVHFIDEIVLNDYDSDTYQLRNVLLDRFGTDNVLITCDSSGRARKTTGKPDIRVLQEVGFEVRYRASGNPRLRKRQLLVNGLLAKKKILINAKKCPTLHRDFRKVKQDEKTYEKIKKDPKLTHASDTVDYLIDFEFEIMQKESFSRQRIF